MRNGTIPICSATSSASQRSLPIRVMGTDRQGSPARGRQRTSAPSLPWPSQINTADTVTGRPISALTAWRPPSIAGATDSMAIRGEAIACSTEAPSAIDYRSTVHMQHLAADVRGVATGQIDVGRCQFGWLSRPLHRGVGAELRDLILGEGRGDERRPDRPGGHAVDADVSTGQV